MLIMCACTRTINLTDTSAYTDEVYVPEYAGGFKVYSLPDDSTSLALEVYRPDTMRIAIPRGGYRSLMCMSSTYVGGLTALGADSLIVAVSGKDYLNNQTVKAKAAEAGYEGAMDYEAILAAKPDIALIYGIAGRSPIEDKLKELSIPIVYINDFEEQNPLGRAEWMVALGALAGIDGRARFTEIKKAYTPVGGETTVMINAPYSGNWFIPGRENYMSKLIADAGGQICVNQVSGTQSITIDLEKALPALASAQIWLNPGQVNTMAEAQRLVPKGKFNAAVWNQTSDFYESGASRPDLVLDELKQIFKGTAADSLRYFTRLR